MSEQQQSTTEEQEEHQPTRISGKSAQRAATWFNYGNIVAVLIPLPLFIFWTGMSMLIYALNRHHPNPKVGYYTQQAAYRFYAIAGAAVAAAIFATGLTYYLVVWIIAAIVLIPWSIYDLYRIKHDTWEDSFTEPPEQFEDHK